MKTKQLKSIIDQFEKILIEHDPKKILAQSDLIRIIFNKSQNKFWLIKQIIHNVVLSNDEIIKLLRIIFKQ